jgi:hypothetical protein
MNTLIEGLFPEGRPAAVEFHPVSRYFGPIDAMVYVREDGSYRADRVDPFLTILWHPTEERLVGVKLKGFRFLFEQILAIDPELKKEHFVSFVRALEFAFAAGLGEKLTDEHEETRKRKRVRNYAEARKFVKDVTIPGEELKKAA